MDVPTSFGSSAHQILVSSEDSSGDDSQEKADHVQHHRGPQQTVQVDHVPAAADPGELVVLCVVLCAGRQGSHVHMFSLHAFKQGQACAVCI